MLLMKIRAQQPRGTAQTFFPQENKSFLLFDIGRKFNSYPKNLNIKIYIQAGACIRFCHSFPHLHLASCPPAIYFLQLFQLFLREITYLHGRSVSVTRRIAFLPPYPPPLCILNFWDSLHVKILLYASPNTISQTLFVKLRPHHLCKILYNTDFWRWWRVVFSP